MTPLRWSYVLGAGVLLLILILAFAGCTTQKPWQGMYVRAAYQYGRIEAKAETLCASKTPSPALVDACKEAKADQAIVRELTPLIDAELAKSEPNWDVIAKYVGLVLNIAGKFIP